MRNLILLTMIAILSVACEKEPIEIIVTQEAPQEIWGQWEPEFTNQTENFTQTRHSSLMSQESREIIVTVSSEEIAVIEEDVNLDLNGDEDMLDTGTIIVNTYRSALLGAHHESQVSSEITTNKTFFAIDYDDILGGNWLFNQPSFIVLVYWNGFVKVFNNKDHLGGTAQFTLSTGAQGFILREGNYGNSWWEACDSREDVQWCLDFVKTDDGVIVTEL